MHPESRRYAILEEGHGTVWLYLTVAGGLKPIADVWVANSSLSQPSNTRDFPPPAPGEVTVDGAACGVDYTQSEWLLGWNEHGESVALFKDGKAIAVLSARDKRGWCKNLSTECSWGRPWDDEDFHRLLG